MSIAIHPKILQMPVLANTTSAEIQTIQPRALGVIQPTQKADGNIALAKVRNIEFNFYNVL